MSDEHKRKLAEGRERHYAALQARKAAETTDASDAEQTERATLEKRIAELETKNEELRKRAGLLTDDELAALPKGELFFEYRTGQADSRGIAIGGRIDDPDDPRWQQISDLRRPVYGSLIENEFVRAKSGEVLERIQRSGMQIKNPSIAREAMRAWAKQGTAGLVKAVS